MFNEIHKKAKAVLKKVNNHTTSPVSVNIPCNSNKLKCLSDDLHRSHINIINDENYENDISEFYNDKELLDFDIIRDISESDKIKLNSYFINNPLYNMNEIINDKMFLKEHTVYIGGWLFCFIVIITTIIILSNKLQFINGFLLGVIVIVILLLIHLFYTYSKNYQLHKYCNDLRNYIKKEFERESQMIDLATIPTSGIVNKLQHTYKGWVYITKTEYDKNKQLIEMNPVIAFIKFGKVSLRIYLVDMIGNENKKIKNLLFTVYRQYHLNYNRINFEIISENVSKKRYWSKKFPIKITYDIDSIVEKKVDFNDDNIYKKILSKLDDEKTFGCLPSPNIRYNRNDFKLNVEGGNIYLFALTGREKERWYQSLKSCIKSQNIEKRKKITLDNFAILNVDPFSLKVDFIKHMKELIAHHKAINNSELNTTQNFKNYIKQLLQEGLSNKKLNNKDNIKQKSSILNLSTLEDENLNITNNTVSKSTQDVLLVSNDNQNNKKKINKNKDFNDDWISLPNILFGKSILALNILATRLMWDFWREDKWTEQVKIKIQTKIDSLKLPPFIKSIKMINLDLGKNLPVVCSNCDPVLDYEGGLWLNLPLAYDGKLSFTFNTQLNVSLVNNLITKAYTSSSTDLHLQSNLSDCNSNEKFAQQILNNLKIFEDNEDVLLDSDDLSCDNLPTTFSNASSSRKETIRSNDIDDFDFKINDLENYENTFNDNISNSKMDALLNSKSGKKIFNVVEKLAQSKLVKKLGKTELAKKMYNAAINKLSNLNVILSVEINSLKGTLILYVPPPPSDRIWFGFKNPPIVNLNIYTKLNSKNIKLPMLTQFIDSKIRSEFNDVLVFPNMEDLVIPVMTPDSDVTYS